LTTFFFFGSLRHVPLLETVLGRAVSASDISQGRVTQAEVRWAGEDRFPLIVLGQGDGANGLVVRNLSDDDVARLDFYEGDAEYIAQPLTLEDGRDALCYMPASKLGAPGDLWSYEDWLGQLGAFTLEAAREYMGYFGVMPEAEADAQWPAIQKRAWARSLAATKTADAQVLQGRVAVESQTRAYSKFFALDEFRLRHETFAGAMSAPLDRAVFMGMDCAMVLPYDPARDRVLLVEQIRLGPVARGDAQAWQLEPIAGHVDPGESPEATAHREAFEEAGLTLRTLEPVAGVYPAPGASSEFYHAFVGLAALPDDITGVAGLAEEGENIRSHLLSYDAFFAMAERQTISVAPLAMLAYWLAHHRTRLRNA